MPKGCGKSIARATAGHRPVTPAIFVPGAAVYRPLPYSQARRLIRTGYIGLGRPTSAFGHIISDGTDSLYSHAVMFGWASRNVLMIGETRQWYGSRLITASDEFAAYPGCYDVFAIAHSPHYSPWKAWEQMCRAAGSRYGWNCIRWQVLHALGITAAPILNSDEPYYLRDCSALVQWAVRTAGGPVLKEHDSEVTPGDWAATVDAKYQFTVVADAKISAAFLDQGQRAAA